jgi:hypothetical protein
MPNAGNAKWSTSLTIFHPPPKKVLSISLQTYKCSSEERITMALIFSQTPFNHVVSQNSQPSTDTGSCKSYLPNATAAPLTARREDDYGESDASLHGYNCELDSSSFLNCSLQTVDELLSYSLKSYRKAGISISPIESGVYVFQAGRETSIGVRIREDVGMVQLSAVVHETKLGNAPSNKTRRRSGYSLLMTMMRLNAQLSRTSCGGRICVCDGRFLFFQDFPISILNGNDSLRRKLDGFILETVEISRGFDRMQ